MGAALHAREPFLEPLHGALPEWHGAVLATLAVQADAGRVIESDIADAHGDDLGDAGPGVVQRGEQDVIAVAAPRGAIRRPQNRFHLLPGEKAQERPVEALGGNGECALDGRQDRGVAESGVVQEGPERSESHIAGPGAILALALEMIEKTQDQRGIQICQRQRGRGLVQSALGVAEKQTKRIPVAGHGARARLTLRDEALAEVVLEQRWKSRTRWGHRSPPWSA